MAFSSVTARGSATEKTSDTGISMSPSANLTVGKLVVVTCVTDNDSTATSDGASSRHSSVADTQGHTWTKATEYTDSDGAAADGTTISVWYTTVTTQITTANSITLTTASAVTNKIISCFEVTKDSASTVAVRQVGVGQSAIAASVSSLPFGEYLLVGAAGSEGNDNTKTADADYTERFDLRTGSGTAATETAMHVQTRIASLTSDTCTSTGWTNTNPIALLIAFYESFPAISTLKDNFNDNSIDAGLWDAYYDGGSGSIAETSGQAQLSPSASSSPGYASYDSLARYSLAGSQAFVQIPQALNADANTETFLSLRFDDDNAYIFVIKGATPTIYAIENVAGSYATVASASYNSTSHKWLRIRESGGTVYWDTSSDGESWSNFASTGADVAVDSLLVRLSTYANNVASPGTAIFDNFNIPRVNTSRSAEVHGQSTANSSRAAEVEGDASGTSTNSTRPAEVHGSASASSVRSAEVTGVSTANSARSAEVTGQASTSSARSAEAHGVDSANSSRAAEVTGLGGASTARASEVHGQDSATSSMAAEVHGASSSSASRSAEVEGTQGANTSRAAEIYGVDTASSSRSAEIIGAQTVNDSRAAELYAETADTSNRAAEVHGTTADTSQRSAEIIGGAGASDTISAEVHGTQSAAAIRGAEVEGASSAHVARSAEVHGAGTSLSQRDAEVDGSAPSADSRNAELTGTATAASTRAAEVDGRLTAQNSRAAEIEGITYVPGSRYQRVKRYAPRANVATRADLYTPAKKFTRRDLYTPL